MRKAKTLTALTVALALALSLAACGGGGSAPAATTAAGAASTTAAPTTAATTAAPAAGATTAAGSTAAATSAPAAPAATTTAAGAVATTTAAAAAGKPDFGPQFTQAPYWEEPQTFTVWAGMDRAAGAISDWSENLVYAKMAEVTNVTVDFLHPPIGGETEQFNLMCASGDYPDAIQWNWLGASGGPANYINTGVIQPLNELFAANTPHMNAYFAERQDVFRETMLDDGTLYCLPAVYGDIELATSTGPIVREDLLHHIGMTPETLPMTIDEWEVMLTDVKNSPELADVIPLTFGMINDIAGCPLFLGAHGITQEWYNDDGTVKFGILQPEYKEFLALMRRWYENGLLDPEFAALDAKTRDEKVTGGRVFTFIGAMGGAITRYTAMVRPTNPDFKLIPMNFPTLTPGEICPVGQQGNFFIGGLALTTQCENPEMICQYYDYFYSDEGHLFSNWGLEGETFEYDADGNLQFTPLIKDNPDGLSREQAMAKYTIWQFINPVFKNKDVLEQRDSLPEQIERRKNWMACENLIKMPPVTPTAEEASEYATIFTDCQTYYRERATAIIMGTADLDGGYEEMVNTLRGMGIERAQELRQAALTRYLARP